MIRVVLDTLLRRHDGTPVVDGASLEIGPGEMMYVVGPAGAGKTTLFRLILGLEPLDDGEIYFDGRALARVPPGKRRVGALFAGDALWPHWTIARNVEYPAKVRGLARAERRKRVEEALARTNIEGLGDRRPAALTRAQARRAALARALVAGPDLLLCDQPLDGLEGRDREEFADDLRRIQSESRTTALVLTDGPREALACADRIAVMDLGRIIQIGTPWEVYHRPIDAFVAEFLGPANMIQGQLESTDSQGGAVVRAPIGRLVGLAPRAQLPAGAPVTVIIRPESLMLCGPGPASGGNRLAATLDRLVFLGGLCQVLLRGPGDWPLTALVLPSQASELREGQPLTLSLAPERVIVLPSRMAQASA